LNEINNLKQARLDAGLTQKAMSEMFEIPLRTIVNWELGERKAPPYTEKLIIDKLKDMNRSK